MAISVNNTVVLINFPSRKVGPSLPYLFSIYATTGVVMTLGDDLAEIQWSNKLNTIIPKKDLVVYNSKEHKDLLQLFESSKKFPPHALVVLKDNPKSDPAVVLATDWNSQSVLVEWPNNERHAYLSKSLMLYQERFDPNLAFKQRKKGKISKYFIKTVKELDEDDVPF